MRDIKKKDDVADKNVPSDVVSAPRRRRYSLNELIGHHVSDSRPMAAEDREWRETLPIGREL